MSNGGNKTLAQRIYRVAAWTLILLPILIYLYVEFGDGEQVIRDLYFKLSRFLSWRLDEIFQ